MPPSDPLLLPALPERHMRRLSAIALLLLIPCTMAAVSWRDVREIRRERELQAIEVTAGQSASYNDTRISLNAMRAIPPDPGLPADRTFLRARLIVEPARTGTQWLDCRLRVTDDQGRSWTSIEPVPSLVARTLAQAGEPQGNPCGGLAVSEARAGDKVVIDAYYLLPREAIPGLHVTLSTMDGRPAYLRFSASTAP